MTQADNAQDDSGVDIGLGLGLAPMSVPKSSDVLANHLRQQILEGKLVEGSALPVERALATSVGLGRQTVRDALRVLEIEGLIVTRPGRAGGSFVRRPDTATFERTLNVLVSGRGVKFHSLLEAREGLEPVAARLAALHRTDDDLVALDRVAAKMAESRGNVPLFLQCNVEWHVAVGAATHNEVIEAIVNSLSKVILRSTDIEEFNSEETMGATLEAHSRILKAIRAGDADKAASSMSKHVHVYRELVENLNVPEDIPM
ncbi:GntR family transcriptional regulator [Nocardioides psychrotolerans]|uniref:DNA-binding transcriptional regulator, FadR family n=2 Tax=Nocardioides psychrotolerans TaxID=1005945 RepID=A0A1I3IP00_9ACTN|nr:GntR family transcriptional regulator [Nocardioides psychrotolerans]SFI49708.1 DNA-binding transcriptional regulator, FadR family [Nocardioides psychrotolerans]